MKRSSIAFAILLALACTLLASWSEGAVLRVPSRYATIQAALSAATPGDTVLVAPGAYVESLTMPSGVRLISEAGPNLTFIDGGGSKRVITCSNASPTTLISGFTVQNGRASGGGGIYVYRGSPVIENNIFRSNSSLDDGGALYCLQCSADIVNNTFKSNSANKPAMFDGGAIFAYGTCRAKVAYNVFQENAADEGGAILITTPYCSLSVTENLFWENSAVWGGAIAIGQAAPRMENNTFFANTAVGGAGVAAGLGAEPALVKNIFAGHTAGAIRCMDAGNVTSSCNDMWNTGPNYEGCSFDTSANLSLDPLFCDPVNGEFHLQPDSPCTDHPDCGLIGAYGAGCPPVLHAHYPEILSVSRRSLAFGQPTTLKFCIVSDLGGRLLDVGEAATVSSLFGLGTLGSVTELPDTAYAVTYTAGNVPGSDSISVYDPECGVEQYAWTTIEIMPPPRIVSVEDVPGDEGGRVVVRWTRSGLDVAPETTISHYSVWRSIDSPAAQGLTDALLVSLADVGPGFVGPGHRTTSTGGGVSGERSHYWEWVGNVPAHWFEGYSLAAPTLMDSTEFNPGWHYFLVSAHTRLAGVFIDSYPDSGYSVDNIPPSAPQGLAGQYTSPPDQVLIVWRRGLEPDVAHYALYKGGKEDFAPSEVELIGTTADTFFVDRGFDDVRAYYKVSAVDCHGNESGFSLLRPEDIAGAPGSAPVPRVTQLAQNVPNPFGPSTTIQFALAQPGWVSLGVYDVSGRPVRILVEGRREARHYSVSWDGRDDEGNAVAPGIYLYKLEAPGYAETKKMVSLK